MATPPNQLGEKIAGVMVEKSFDGVFKIIESLDKKFDILLQAFLDAGFQVPPKKP
jgi:hypothetical protein